MRWEALWIGVCLLLIAIGGCAASSRQRDSCQRAAGGVVCDADSPRTADSTSRLPSLARLHGPDAGPAVGADSEREQLSIRRPKGTWQQISSPIETRKIVAASEQDDRLHRLPPPVPATAGGALEDSVNTVDMEEVLTLDRALTLDDVLRSVYGSYPLLRVAVQQRTIANGQLLEAHGEFDLKLKGGGTSGPLGFYQTNRFGTGFEQALFSGGEVFAGYRIGRGNFQPWFGERETNDGGEFKAGFLIPLLQNHRIDDRRAMIFRSALGRDAVEPDILLQLIDFVRAASHAYWDWVAAGQVVQIEQALLDIALQRQGGMQKRVQGGDLPRIELTDNERLIVSRRAALIDAQRKFQQSAIKLSLFYRAPDGQPTIPPSSSYPGNFPDGQAYEDQQLEADIQTALAGRPETQFLEFVREQLEVDLAQALNLHLPEVSLGATASQDLGAAASATGDKTPFELEGSLLLSVPLQRRKALGKLQTTQGKLAQVRSKTQYAGELISTDVQSAVTALKAAYERVFQAQQSVQLNDTMENAERRRFDAGDSNLLIVNLREQATADARKTLVGAQLEYFRSEADYRAALGTIPIPDRAP